MVSSSSRMMRHEQTHLNRKLRALTDQTANDFIRLTG